MLWINIICFVVLQDEEDIDWSILKPDIFASIMDFFASNVPILTEEQPSSDTGEVKTVTIACRN